MSTSPRFSERKPASAPLSAQPEETSTTERKQTLAERLYDMSDYQLVTYQASAIRIGKDAAHAKHAFAQRALPLIEAEVGRRAEEECVSREEPSA